MRASKVVIFHVRIMLEKLNFTGCILFQKISILKRSEDLLIIINIQFSLI